MPCSADSLAKQISELAHVIWREHYIPIIGREQTEYMLSRFQSPGAISEQIKEGHNYRLILSGDAPVGYSSHVYGDDGCFVSKLYLLKEHRGKGLGMRRLRDIWFAVAIVASMFVAIAILVWYIFFTP